MEASRDALKRALPWLNPYTWPTPTTRAGVALQTLSGGLIVPIGVLAVMWLGTPGT